MKKYTQIRDLNLEEFKQYYYNHSNKDTIKYFNLSKDSFYKLLSLDDFPHIRCGKINKYKNIINKNELLNYYNNHTLDDTAKYFNTTKFIISNILDNYNIDKHTINKNRELGCMKKYGVKHYSYTDEFKNKVHNTYLLKSEEEKLKRSNNISKAFNNMDDIKREERLIKIKHSSINKISKPNNNFYNLLLENNFTNIETEFILGKYIYDFKLNNILIEINPFATHNSNWGYRNGKPKDKYYHYNKVKYAKNNGYECICVWDWSNINYILKNLNNHITIQNNIKIHYYNIITKEHRIIDKVPDNLMKNEVIIYDDGQEISYLNN